MQTNLFDDHGQGAATEPPRTTAPRPRIHPKGGGIYRIQNTVSGKFYIGSTTEFARRWETHKRTLNQQKHYNPYLQTAWNKYGAGAFVFEVVEVIENRDLLQPREQHWLDTCKPFKGVGYNQCTAVAGLSGYRHTEEAKRKIAEASRRRKGCKVSGEALARIRLRAQDPEIKAKISAANKGRKPPTSTIAASLAARANMVVSQETRDKISRLHKGSKRSEETRKRMSGAIRSSEKHKAAMKILGEKRKIGRGGPDEERARSYSITTPDGQASVIRNLSLFCRENDLHLGHMTEIAQGKRKTYKKWKCAYFD